MSIVNVLFLIFEINKKWLLLGMRSTVPVEHEVRYDLTNRPARMRTIDNAIIWDLDRSTVYDEVIKIRCSLHVFELGIVYHTNLVQLLQDKMVKDLTFDVRFDNELAHNYYGDGKELAEHMREIYHDKNLQFPNEFQSTLTTPPVHFMSVEALDDADVKELRKVNVPPGLNIEILDLKM